MTLTLDELDFKESQIRTRWTCMAPTFPHPMRGQDVWTIEHGRILRLETTFLP